MWRRSLKLSIIFLVIIVPSPHAACCRGVITRETADHNTPLPGIRQPFAS